MDLESLISAPKLLVIRRSNQFGPGDFVEDGVTVLNFDGTNVGNIDEFLVQADVDFPHKSQL